MLANKIIVVPTDFSEFSDEAFVYAIRLAGVYGSTLHVVHVVASTFSLDDAQAVHLSKVQEVRERLNQLLPGDGSSLQIHRHVLEGSAASEIVNFAKQFQADLIVMGTHGRTGVTHLLMGSVAEKVVRQAICPVLVVRPRLETVKELPTVFAKVSVQPS